VAPARRRRFLRWGLSLFLSAGRCRADENAARRNQRDEEQPCNKHSKHRVNTSTGQIGQESLERSAGNPASNALREM